MPKYRVTYSRVVTANHASAAALFVVNLIGHGRVQPEVEEIKPRWSVATHGANGHIFLDGKHLGTFDYLTDAALVADTMNASEQSQEAKP